MTLRQFSTRHSSTIKTHPGIDQVTPCGIDRLRPDDHYRRCRSAGAERLAGAPGKQQGQAGSELQITDEGQRILCGIEPAVQAAQRIMLRGLTADEAEQFLRLCGRPSLRATN